MLTSRSPDTDRPAHSRDTSVPQRLARSAAVHPWRVVGVWSLILAASIVAIGTLIGSAFTADGSITTNPDSMKADQVVAENFSQADRTDDAIVIQSPQLTSDDPAFRTFVDDLRASVASTDAADTVRDPYADDGYGISQDGHAAVITLVLGHDAETGSRRSSTRSMPPTRTPPSSSTSPARTPSTTTSPSSRIRPHRRASCSSASRPP